jgi:hypothetical protein
MGTTIKGIHWESTGEKVTGEPGWEYLEGCNASGTHYEGRGLVRGHDFEIVEVEDIEIIDFEEKLERLIAENRRMEKINNWIRDIKKTLDDARAV